MTTHIRNDGKVYAKLLVDNGETAIYWAAWRNRDGETEYNFTACPSDSFNTRFTPVEN